MKCRDFGMGYDPSREDCNIFFGFRISLVFSETSQWFDFRSVKK